MKTGLFGRRSRSGAVKSPADAEMLMTQLAECMEVLNTQMQECRAMQEQLCQLYRKTSIEMSSDCR